jgi:hypothetical protein
MMTNTVNQSWAIPEKFINRYGKIWAELDFEINPKLSNYAFRNDPLNTIVGTLLICQKRIPLKYKQLVKSLNVIDQYISDIHFNKVNKTATTAVKVFNNTFYLKKHEITKLYETITDSCDTIMKSYQLGTYL